MERTIEKFGKKLLILEDPDQGYDVHQSTKKNTFYQSFKRVSDQFLTEYDQISGDLEGIAKLSNLKIRPEEETSGCHDILEMDRIKILSVLFLTILKLSVREALDEIIEYKIKEILRQYQKFFNVGDKEFCLLKMYLLILQFVDDRNFIVVLLNNLVEFKKFYNLKDKPEIKSNVVKIIKNSFEDRKHSIHVKNRKRFTAKLDVLCEVYGNEIMNVFFSFIAKKRILRNNINQNVVFLCDAIVLFKSQVLLEEQYVYLESTIDSFSKMLLDQIDEFKKREATLRDLYLLTSTISNNLNEYYPTQYVDIKEELYPKLLLMLRKSVGNEIKEMLKDVTKTLEEEKMKGVWEKHFFLVRKIGKAVKNKEWIHEQYIHLVVKEHEKKFDDYFFIEIEKNDKYLEVLNFVWNYLHNMKIKMVEQKLYQEKPKIFLEVQEKCVTSSCNLFFNYKKRLLKRTCSFLKLYFKKEYDESAKKKILPGIKKMVKGVLSGHKILKEPFLGLFVNGLLKKMMNIVIAYFCFQMFDDVEVYAIHTKLLKIFQKLTKSKISTVGYLNEIFYPFFKEGSEKYVQTDDIISMVMDEKKFDFPKVVTKLFLLRVLQVRKKISRELGKKLSNDADLESEKYFSEKNELRMLRLEKSSKMQMRNQVIFTTEKSKSFTTTGKRKSYREEPSRKIKKHLHASMKSALAFGAVTPSFEMKKRPPKYIHSTKNEQPDFSDPFDDPEDEEEVEKPEQIKPKRTRHMKYASVPTWTTKAPPLPQARKPKIENLVSSYDSYGFDEDYGEDGEYEDDGEFEGEYDIEEGEGEYEDEDKINKPFEEWSVQDVKDFFDIVYSKNRITDDELRRMVKCVDELDLTGKLFKNLTEDSLIQISIQNCLLEKEEEGLSSDEVEKMIDFLENAERGDEIFDTSVSLGGVRESFTIDDSIVSSLRIYDDGDEEFGSDEEWRKYM